MKPLICPLGTQLQNFVFHGSSEGVVTKLRAGGPENSGPIIGSYGQYAFLFYIYPGQLWAHPVSHPGGRELFLRWQSGRNGKLITHLYPEHVFTPTPPILFQHMVGLLISTSAFSSCLSVI